MQKIKVTLKAARVNASYTQVQAAQKLGVTANTVSRWESGKSRPTIEACLKMCKLYNLTLDDIFYPCNPL